jgi:hypothetical protein
MYNLYIVYIISQGKDSEKNKEMVGDYFSRVRPTVGGS